MITRNSKVASDKFETWDQIDWFEVERFVRKRQIKIAEAVKSGDWKRVRNLQDRFVNMHFAKLLAIKTVTCNKGKHTAGVDGVVWITDAMKLRAAKELRWKGYRPMALKRVMIPKPDGSERPLGIPTIKDRAMQCLYKMALEPVAETTADRNSFGFRLRRSAHDAIQRCFNIYSGKDSAIWVLEGDIKKCFDEISHEWLLKNIPMDKRTLKNWLKAGFVWENELFDTSSGTPQGGIISPILANMCLDGIERLFDEHFGRKSRRRVSLKIHLVRYADDFIVSCSSKEVLKTEVMPLLKEFLGERGLEISKEKSKITHISEGFDFLGFNIRKYRFEKSDSKLLIKPSKKSMKRFLRGLKDIIARNKTAKQSSLILMLNMKISGWCNYFRIGVAKETFSYIDHKIWEMLWKWARRRHHNKSKGWVKDRYFRGFKGNRWRFVDNESGNMIAMASNYKIQRHIKIQKEAEVFNPAWDKYFELK